MNSSIIVLDIISMGLLSLTAITCAFFLLTSIGHLHQKNQESNSDDFSEFDDEEYGSIPVRQSSKELPDDTEAPFDDTPEPVNKQPEKPFSKGKGDGDFKDFEDEVDDDVLIEEEVRCSTDF